MKQTKLLLLLLLISINSCKKNNENINELNTVNTKQDTTKLFQKIKIIYGEEKRNSEEYEGYVSKEKDTFWNQWKFYKNGSIDSTKSKFYNLNVEGKKGDSILKGMISFYSPADSIPKSKVDSRNVTFLYLQRENDSLIFKEIKSDQNVIYFDYKDLDSLKFIGYISDLRYIKIDSMPEKLLLSRNYFAIDSEVSTNNTFVELLK